MLSPPNDDIVTPFATPLEWTNYFTSFDGVNLLLGGLPVASASPVTLCAILAALATDLPCPFSFWYRLSTLVPLGI